MEAEEIEKAIDFGPGSFQSGQKEVTKMTNADLPSFGLGRRTKKKEGLN